MYNQIMLKKCVKHQLTSLCMLLVYVVFVVVAAVFVFVSVTVSGGEAKGEKKTHLFILEPILQPSKMNILSYYWINNKLE